jgi:hypothetical protein
MNAIRAILVSLAALLALADFALAAEPVRELKVHLAQANNDSPYAFVRAKFRPGEIADPWAVRFLDPKGEAIPYFVWDSTTWRVAREGRTDWGNRYALLNHGPGDAPEVREARGRKLEAARKSLPALAARLDAEETAARKSPDSVCAAIYLLRRRVPAFGKERVTLRILGEPEKKPKHQEWKGEKVGDRVAARQGELEFRGLPDKLVIAWKGKELFQCAGFDAGGQTGATSHADAARPFAIDVTEGIITRVVARAQTAGRQGGAMDWQTTYWLFPEGGHVALQGFAIGDAAGYVGGAQKLAILQAEKNFTQRNLPSWEKPWWLHDAGEGRFIATHLLYATPLATGFGNNPFAVNAEGPDKDPRVEAKENQLALRWFHRSDDPAITRLMWPQPMRRPGAPAPAPAKDVPWQSKTDWLYRQYIAGMGEKAESAEGSLRAILGAAAGWIDRPISEEAVAAGMISMMPRISNRQSSEIGLLGIVPALIADDSAAVRESLRKTRDQTERTDFYINLIKKHVELGGRPSDGGKALPDGSRREGWTGNPCYHATNMPCYVRVLEHFEVPFKQKEYRDSIVRFADFSLDILGGNPTDFDKLDATFQSEWPSRIVPIIPLMLHARSLKNDDRYDRAAKMLFNDLMRLVERNPHGYWPTWSFRPKADKFDTVYNPVGNERGISALWCEGRLDLIGRETASRFVAAQARWMVFSGQLLDTLETDNTTAIRACTHGGHTGVRNQIGIYLYDDFDFYRGLVGELVDWSAANSQIPGPLDAWAVGAHRSLELSNAGSSMLRWALDIRPGSKAHESKIERVGDNGVRLRAWNRLPKSKPTFKTLAKDAGLKGDAEVMQIQMHAAAFRLPAEFQASWNADKVTVKVGQPAKVRLHYGVIRPEWDAKVKVTLRRIAGGDAAVADVVFKDGYAEWQATAGEYEIMRGE